MDITEICRRAGRGQAGLAAAVTTIATLSRSEVEKLVERALHPDVPVDVLFAALDRFTALSADGGGRSGAGP